MLVFKKYNYEKDHETFCVFDYDEKKEYVDITGAENFGGQWFFFNVQTPCDMSRLDDTKYIDWLLYDENECEGFSCGSFDSFEELLEHDKENYFDASILRYFLKNS